MVVLKALSPHKSLFSYWFGHYWLFCLKIPFGTFFGKSGRRARLYVEFFLYIYFFVWMYITFTQECFASSGICEVWNKLFQMTKFSCIASIIFGTFSAKWNKHSAAFWLNFLFYVIFLTVLNIYVVIVILFSLVSPSNDFYISC